MAAASPWVVSARYDATFFTASLGVPLLLWAGFAHGLLTGVAVYVAFQLLFNMPHNFQTWTMSVLDPADRRAHGRRYLVAAAVCLGVLGIPMALSPDGVYPWVRDALIYWGYYHLVRQHYGFQRIYERKTGDVPELESKLYGRYLDLACYLPLLLRFHDPKLMTIDVGKGPTIPIWHPTLDGVVHAGLLGLYVAAIGAVVVHHLWMLAKGRQRLLPRALLLLSVTAAFALAGLAIENLIVSIAVVTAYHNLQYLGLMWFHNRNRAADRPADENRTIRRLVDGRAWLYLAVTFFYGVAIIFPRAVLTQTPLAQLPLAFVVAMHYYVDSRMWRFQMYPERGRWLRLRA